MFACTGDSIRSRMDVVDVTWTYSASVFVYICVAYICVNACIPCVANVHVCYVVIRVRVCVFVYRGCVVPGRQIRARTASCCRRRRQPSICIETFTATGWIDKKTLLQRGALPHHLVSIQTFRARPSLDHQIRDDDLNGISILLICAVLCATFCSN